MMKKSFLLVVALGAAMMMQAQHANRIEPLSTNLQIDSMRVQFASDPASMVAALQLAESTLQADEKMLKEAQKQVKDEASYAKSLASYIKSSTGALNELKKAYSSDLKGLDKMQASINDQLNALHKITLDDREYLAAMEHKLKGYLSAIHGAMDRINASSRAVDDQLQDASRQQSDLETFNNEIASKQEQLKALQGQHKANKDAVKNEMKAWKGLAK